MLQKRSQDFAYLVWFTSKLKPALLLVSLLLGSEPYWARISFARQALTPCMTCCCIHFCHREFGIMILPPLLHAAALRALHQV